MSDQPKVTPGIFDRWNDETWHMIGAAGAFLTFGGAIMVWGIPGAVLAAGLIVLLAAIQRDIMKLIVRNALIDNGHVVELRREVRSLRERMS